ncbi:MAG: RNA methyltransferase [Kiritimatiellae bacterium]|jgi:23S rRNA (guanosine2251-2'-O)-methyltransferase|nr:RNA methyltransferase [Kiritimatiellia bacterium]
MENKKLQNMPQEQIGRLILKKANELDGLWEDAAKRADIIDEILTALPLLTDYPHIQKLDRILKSADSRKAFWSFLVPLERQFSLKNINDTDILVLEDDKQKTTHTTPAIVILDNIRSALNIGSIFRISECFSFEKIILCGYTSTPENSKIAKSAMGTHEIVDWEYQKNITNAINDLKKQGYTIYALETVEKSTPIQNVNWKSPLAIIVGNERFGITKEILSLVDEIVQIPLTGTKNSLNVSTAFSICAHEISKDKQKEGLRTLD